MKSILIRKPYQDRKRYPFVSEKPTLTEQCHAQECDINVIVSGIAKTGSLPDPEQPSIFGDGSPVDFQQMQNTVSKVRAEFDLLPAGIRADFEHDPQNLLDVMHDHTDDQKAYLVKNGFLAPDPTPEVDKPTNAMKRSKMNKPTKAPATGDKVPEIEPITED